MQDTTVTRPVPAISELPTGTLVVTDPLPRYVGRIPARTGIVVSPYGPVETASMVLVWFWGLGRPVPARSVHAIFPKEITILATTLETMPQGAFESVARGIADGWSNPDLAALVGRVTLAARNRRDRRTA